MKSFYRYLRPVRFNPARLDYDTQPNGGICLRFEEDRDGTLWFTHSRCHPDDHFNKAVAKQIADSRAAVIRCDPRLKAASGGLPFTEDSAQLVHAVAHHCVSWVPPYGTHGIVLHYLHNEWQGLAAAINRISVNNFREMEKGRIWTIAADAVGALSIYSQGNP